MAANPRLSALPNCVALAAYGPSFQTAGQRDPLRSVPQRGTLVTRCPCSEQFNVSERPRDQINVRIWYATQRSTATFLSRYASSGEAHRGLMSVPRLGHFLAPLQIGEVASHTRRQGGARAFPVPSSRVSATATISAVESDPGALRSAPTIMSRVHASAPTLNSTPSDSI